MVKEICFQQAFSEKCELPCELSQSNVLWSELDKSALHQAQEKCIFRALARVPEVSHPRGFWIPIPWWIPPYKLWMPYWSSIRDSYREHLNASPPPSPNVKCNIIVHMSEHACYLPVAKLHGFCHWQPVILKYTVRICIYKPLHYCGNTKWFPLIEQCLKKLHHPLGLRTQKC